MIREGMKTSLVIGANRGIGFEIAKQLREKRHDVIATYRQSAGALQELDVEAVGGVDIADDKGIKHLVQALEGRKLDNVFIVSGILRRDSLEQPAYDDVLAQLVVNAVGPLRAAEALFPQIPEGGRLGILTSRMGSIADNTSGGMYGYRMSKAAVNAAGVSLAQDLRDKGISVGLFHPGYVRTEMTGGNGHIDPDESARLLIERLYELNLENSGSFWHSNGEKLPW